MNWFRYRWQTASLFAAVAIVVVAILATDLATGGDSESPPPLGTAYPTSEAGGRPPADAHAPTPDRHSPSHDPYRHPNTPARRRRP